MKSYISRIAEKLLQSPGIEARSVVPYFLDNGIMTGQRIMLSARKLAQPQKHWVEVLRHSKLKPQQMLDLLCDINGLMMNDTMAMDFLERYFPEAHEKIEKSRQPSIMSRIVSIFLGMFGKGKSTADKDNNKEKGKDKDKRHDI